MSLTLQNNWLTALGLRTGDAETATGKKRERAVEERIFNHNGILDRCSGDSRRCCAMIDR